MKHAYLILAHTEFELLQLLVQALDDPRNDIYVHFDKRVKELPKLSADQSRLIILTEREKVYWGDVSMIEAEYRLFRAAYTSGVEYAYFHLLSGVDLPLKSQNYIHSFFEDNQGKEFVGFNWEITKAQINTRVRCVHLFPHSFRGAGILFQLKRVIRYSYIVLQKILGFKVNRNTEFHKGGQWVSITRDLVSYLLSKHEELVRMYRYTFAPDEFFIQTLVWGTPFMERLYDKNDEGRGAVRAIGWRNGELVDYTSKDLPYLQTTEHLFARKFNSRDMTFIREVLKLSSTNG